MKTERFLWIAGLLFAAFVIANQSNNNANLQTLLVTYDAESKIQDGQINDFRLQLNAARDASYSKGFEDGKTQAGVALAKGGSLYDYKDGYHAGIAQVVDEAGVLEVSKGIFNELKSLRKMVPRLLNHTQELKTELASLRGIEAAFDFVMDSLDGEDDIDATYLEIIDLLMDTPPPSSRPLPVSPSAIAKETQK